MSRLAFMARHPKRTLGVLALLLAASAVVVGSGANFTASATNPTNVLSTGSLSLGNTPNTAIFTSATATPMKPGDSRAGQVDILNSGTISGAITLTLNNLTNTPSSPNPLSGTLTIKVEDCGLWTNNNTVAPTCSSPTSKYNGTFTGLSAVALGTFAASAEHRYLITVTFPDGTPAHDNPYQGENTQFDLVWNAS